MIDMQNEIGYKTWLAKTTGNYYIIIRQSHPLLILFTVPSTNKSIHWRSSLLMRLESWRLTTPGISHTWQYAGTCHRMDTGIIRGSNQCLSD